MTERSLASADDVESNFGNYFFELVSHHDVIRYSCCKATTKTAGNIAGPS